MTASWLPHEFVRSVTHLSYCYLVKNPPFLTQRRPRLLSVITSAKTVFSFIYKTSFLSGKTLKWYCICWLQFNGLTEEVMRLSNITLLNILKEWVSKAWYKVNINHLVHDNFTNDNNQFPWSGIWLTPQVSTEHQHKHFVLFSNYLHLKLFIWILAYEHRVEATELSVDLTCVWWRWWAGPGGSGELTELALTISIVWAKASANAKLPVYTSALHVQTVTALSH